MNGGELRWLWRPDTPLVEGLHAFCMAQSCAGCSGVVGPLVYGTMAFLSSGREPMKVVYTDMYGSYLGRRCPC